MTSISCHWQHFLGRLLPAKIIILTCKVFHMDSNDIRINLLRAREAAGLTQDALADKVGISRTTYRSIEKGETNLIYKKLGDICEAVGISVEEALLGYLPRRASNDELQEENIFQQQLIAQREQHLKEVQSLHKKIDDLNDALQIKEDSLRTLRDINDRLSKNSKR